MTEEQLQDLEQQAQQDAEEALEDLPEGEEMPYESPEPIEFRGDFKPELVQLLMRMRTQDSDEDMEDLADLSPEEIKELLEKSVEVDVDMDEFDMSQLAALIENLEKEAGTPSSDDDDPGRRARRSRTPRCRRPAARGQDVLLRRVGLPRRGLQAALVRRPRAHTSRRATRTSTRTRCAITPRW